ncbi:MAG: histidine kinase dimerization and phosphoacceptor region [Frankiales bacterium]|nr:histidine kinase dimerization and phosphoacceptor region [Frankiales bacterium]
MNVRRRDLLLALVVAGLVVAGTSHIHPDAGHGRPIDAWAWICGLAGAVALLGWRRLPLAMVGIVAAEVFAYQALNYPGGPALLSAPVALVLLGYRARRPIAFAGAVLMAAVVIVGGVIARGSMDTVDAVSTGWVLAAVLAGQIAAAQVERREFTRHQAATDERLRIAQDLHDSVAHAMATINVQAGVAGHLLDRKPEQVRVALEAIRTASSEVLDELGAIVSVLRDGNGVDAAPRAPVAGLDRVAELVDRAGADGLPVDCTITGDTVHVLPARSAAAYRVVQEALSNTRRHAGEGATAMIRVSVGSDHAISVTVVDDGGRARVPAISTAPGGGLGLVGMRERVESTGGRLQVERISPRGFRVEAKWG